MTDASNSTEYAIGVSDHACEVTEEMQAVMEANSRALAEDLATPEASGRRHAGTSAGPLRRILASPSTSELAETVRRLEARVQRLDGSHLGRPPRLIQP
jgi:hypothetical protein